MSEENKVDVDSLLDGTLDDIEDLPETKAFPPGAHKALASMELKTINDSLSVELTLKHQETIELAEPTSDKAPTPGDEANCLYMLDNKFGAGKFKVICAAFRAGLGIDAAVSNRDVIEQVKGIEVGVITTHRKNSNDPSKPYMNITELEVV